MKDFQQCCKEIAHKNYPHFSDKEDIIKWVEDVFYFSDIKEAADLYASEKIRRAIELAREEKEYLVWSPSDRDWTEDFKHENGKYTNTCIECKLSFNGHKRRVICKKCQTPNWEEIAKRKPPEDTKDNKAWAGAWLEGEMVGYAKCMIEPKEETDLYTPDEIMQKLSEPQK